MTTTQQRREDYEQLRNLPYWGINRDREKQDYRGQNWLIVAPSGRGYGYQLSDELVHESNEASIRQELESRGLEYELVDEFGELKVPLYRGNRKELGYSHAAAVCFDLIASMQDYPLLDEDDYYQREYEAIEEAILDAVSWSLGIYDEGDQELITDELYRRIADGSSEITDYGVDSAAAIAETELKQIAEELGYDTITGERMEQ